MDGIERERENGIYWKDQKDDVDGVTIPTPYLQQFSRLDIMQTDPFQMDTCMYIFIFSFFRLFSNHLIITGRA